MGNIQTKRFWRNLTGISVILIILLCGCLDTSPSWNVTKSEHYTFHYRPGSLAEEQIAFIVEIQEMSYTRITSTLHVTFDQRIDYYLYPSQWDKLFTMGERSRGNANLLFTEIHAVYREGVKTIGCHEDTHIISYWTLGNPPPFLQEGLAVSMMESWYGRPVHEWAQEFLQKKRLIPLKSLLISHNFWKYNTKVTYPQSGSFTKYIIDIYGIEKFKTVYSQAVDETIENVFRNVYGKSIDELEQEWILYLESIGTISE